VTYLATGTTIPIPAGATSFNGTLDVRNGTTLLIASNALTIAGSLTYESGARLSMTSAAGSLTVNGNASFNASDMGDGDLTAGTLELKGDLSAGSAYYQAFRAGPGHLTRFTGSALQHLSFAYPQDDHSRLGTVQFTNAAGLSLTTETVARGDVTVSAATSLTGSRLNVGGLLTSPGGSSLASLADVVIYANGVFPLVTGTAPPMTYLSTGTNVSIPIGNTTFNGSMQVQNGTSLTIGANALTLTGSLAYVGGARLLMTNSSGHVTVNGNAFFNAVDMGDADLTAGTLEVKGDFTAGVNYYQAFRAGPSHITMLNGSAPHMVSFAYPQDDHSRFGTLVYADNAGITHATEVVARGDVSVTGTTAIAGARLDVGGALTTSAGSSLSGVADVVVYAGSSFPSIAGAAPPLLYLANGSVVAAPAGSFAGALTITSGTTLDMGMSTLNINGSLSLVNGARLKMTTSAAHLTVAGAASFNGSDMGDADLTDGILELKGDFSAGTGFYQAFRATGNHLVKFSGTGAQSVSMVYPSFDHSRFQNVLFTNSGTSGVSISGGVRVENAASQLGRLLVPSSLSIGGALSLGSMSITNVSGSLSSGSCSATAGASYSGFTCGP
jgi:hypothetical protein